MNRIKLTDSASAMASVFRLISERPDLIAIFKNTAISWLRLQASRIRDGSDSRDEKRDLGLYLATEVNRQGILAFTGADLEKDLALVAAGTPRQKVVAPAQATTVTCNFPWEARLENRFRDKVIFFCEVNYHIRSAAPIVRALKALGIESIIVDASHSTSFTSNRPLLAEELSLYSDIDLQQFNVAEGLPFSTEAAAFVVMNDLTYTSRLLFENFGFGVPVFGFYEGINDDWNLDRVSPRMPYRAVDHILLPGAFQKGFYSDRNCSVVGLPNIRNRLKKAYIKPVKRRAIINVNFTYGVLEDRRDEYVESAVRACEELGLEYVITQHPADKADLSKYNVGQTSVYDMLEEGSVLISRFSTTMLEALAMGRPIVYHNPIAEKVPKFKQPLGAFSTSDDVNSLKQALSRELDFVDNDGDVRQRAALFLHFHCNTGNDTAPENLAADAIAEMLAEPTTRFAFKTGAKDFVEVPALISTRSEIRNEINQTDIIKLSRTEALPEGSILRSTASALLLEPADTLTRLASGGNLEASVKEAIAQMAEDDPVRIHFVKVRAFAEKKVGTEVGGITQNA